MKMIFHMHYIEFLRKKGQFSEDFLQYLADFRFTGDIWAVPEGTPVFPNEPLLTVRAPAIEAQFIETFILMMINHQSLIATKASRIVRAAKGRVVSEFGSRRAQGSDAAILGARAAYIGGVNSTACTIAEEAYGVPAGGTMAHSWVQMFDSEYEAFKTYCQIYPTRPTLLIDTFNVIDSGVPNAIRVFKELGITECAVRLDSGDITYLTKKIRKLLDDAGLTECKIVVSNSLDEYIIRELIRQGAELDAFGVGERLITAKSDPVFGGVYKVCAIENADGTITPKIKISENVGKITTPHFKKIYRLRGRETGKAEADLLCVYDEVIDDTKPLEIFDPDNLNAGTVGYVLSFVAPLHVLKHEFREFELAVQLLHLFCIFVVRYRTYQFRCGGAGNAPIVAVLCYLLVQFQQLYFKFFGPATYEFGCLYGILVVLCHPLFVVYFDYGIQDVFGTYGGDVFY